MPKILKHTASTCARCQKGGKALKLHCFGESGASYKVALTLQMAGLEWQPVFVDFFNGATRTPEFRALNPMGEVPVLVDGAQVLTQSAIAQRHVARKVGRFGHDDEDVLRWILWDNHKLSGQVGMTRFLMNFVAADKRPEPVIQFQLGRLKAAYAVLEQRLTGRDWIVGDAPSLADFACCSYLYYPEPFGFVRAEWPHIDAWLARLSAQPGWAHPYDLMPGRPSDRA